MQVAFAVTDDQGKEEIITRELPCSYDLSHLFPGSRLAMSASSTGNSLMCAGTTVIARVPVFLSGIRCNYFGANYSRNKKLGHLLR